MPIGGKEAFLSKVTFRRESNWVSKTKHMLKGMETIEGRAEKARLLYFGYLPRDIGVTYKDGYIQGATEQKAIDIEKVCEWLKKHCGMNDSGLVQFRKAMEEEI